MDPSIWAIFGLLWGTVIVSFASTIGATLAFLASRFLLREWVQQDTTVCTITVTLEADTEYTLEIRQDFADYLRALQLPPAWGGPRLSTIAFREGRPLTASARS